MTVTQDVMDYKVRAQEDFAEALMQGDFIVMDDIIERLTNRSLDVLAQRLRKQRNDLYSNGNEVDDSDELRDNELTHS